LRCHKEQLIQKHAATRSHADRTYTLINIRLMEIINSIEQQDIFSSIFTLMSDVGTVEDINALTLDEIKQFVPLLKGILSMWNNLYQICTL
jgi:hypothetical protein